MQAINQIIWTLKNINDQDFARGLISKLDENGNAVENFVILDALTTKVNYFLSVSSISVFEDNSFVISARTYFDGSYLGVSTTSSIDWTLIKVDAQRRIDWATSFDFNNQLDNTSNMDTDNNSVYLAWPSGTIDHYNWIGVVSFDKGEVLIVRWYYKDSLSSTNNRKLKISLISEKFIFVIESFGSPKIFKNF